MTTVRLTDPNEVCRFETGESWPLSQSSEPASWRGTLTVTAIDRNAGCGSEKP